LRARLSREAPQPVHCTQLDPIGLAGGLNSYGFAAGDPINYHDPFGLTVEFKDSKSRHEWNTARRHLRRAARSKDADTKQAAQEALALMAEGGAPGITLHVALESHSEANAHHHGGMGYCASTTVCSISVDPSSALAGTLTTLIHE